MTDEEMLKLARKLKLPPVMWNSVGFRAFLIRVYVAGQGAVAQCRDYRQGGLTPSRCKVCGVHRDHHPGEAP